MDHAVGICEVARSPQVMSDRYNASRAIASARLEMIGNLEMQFLAPRAARPLVHHVPQLRMIEVDDLVVAQHVRAQGFVDQARKSSLVDAHHPPHLLEALAFAEKRGKDEQLETGTRQLAHPMPQECVQVGRSREEFLAAPVRQHAVACREHAEGFEPGQQRTDEQRVAA